MTAVLEDFDLAALVRDVAAQVESPDPGDVAEAVLDCVSDTDLREALRQALRGYVRTHLNARRSDSFSRVHDPLAGPSKWDALRRQKLLDSRLEVGEEKTEWKHLRDCTRDEVLRAAAYRTELAAKNAARAAQLEKLAATMKRYRAETVSDLKDEILAEVFG